MNISRYKTLIFDCDGVVLDSNKVKTRAFYQAALPYGREAAQVLVDYHVSNGGVSRYKKFNYFLDSLIPDNTEGPSLAGLLDCFAEEVRNGLLTCDVSENLQYLRSKTSGSRWLIVSGGDQNELRDVFYKRDLSSLFDGGIFGSPDIKETILSRELENGNISTPAIFLGDSQYDHIAAKSIDIDFLFVRGWTEFSGYADYCASNDLRSIESLSDLLLLK